MGRQVAIGAQDFASLIENNYFYIDKSSFIKDWWNNGDTVTLITRPRRFGKTITMNMLDYFFSNKYAGRGDLFDGLDIWKDEKFRKLQGTYPVIFLTFAGVKQTTYRDTISTINDRIASLYNQYDSLIKDDMFSDADRELFYSVKKDMDETTAGLSLNHLCEWLYRFYGKKCIILLDEYDTPLQEAYIGGFWKELTSYIRALFNNTFKTNPSMERAIMTGITRVSKESIFSDLNNLTVVTTTSDKYATDFGFTFGIHKDIYNPWSITYFLDTGKFDTYWANTSGNGLVGHLIQNGEPDIKMEFEKLISGECIDAGKKPSEESEPEKFYHGFVLGLLVDNAKNYVVKSNRESGFGRYDVVMEPKDKNDVAVIIEFKVYDKEYDGENDLSDTADNALKQIEEKQYAADLLAQGVSEDKILKYGFAFQGKKCLIKK